MRQAGLFGLSDQLKRLSDCGDPLETMGRVVDFEIFRPALEKALAYGAGAKGGRPPYDPVAMFKVLVLAAQNTVSDARMEFSDPRSVKLAAVPGLRPGRGHAQMRTRSGCSARS